MQNIKIGIVRHAIESVSGDASNHQLRSALAVLDTGESNLRDLLLSQIANVDDEDKLNQVYCILTGEVYEKEVETRHYISKRGTSRVWEGGKAEYIRALWCKHLTNPRGRVDCFMQRKGNNAVRCNTKLLETSMVNLIVNNRITMNSSVDLSKAVEEAEDWMKKQPDYDSIVEAWLENKQKHVVNDVEKEYTGKEWLQYLATRNQTNDKRLKILSGKEEESNDEGAENTAEKLDAAADLPDGV